VPNIKIKSEALGCSGSLYRGRQGMSIENKCFKVFPESC